MTDNTKKTVSKITKTPCKSHALAVDCSHKSSDKGCKMTTLQTAGAVMEALESAKQTIAQMAVGGMIAAEFAGYAASTTAVRWATESYIVADAMMKARDVQGV